jgi:DNA helicase-2/ATP-dependent DNA helicase PcrA
VGLAPSFTIHDRGDSEDLMGLVRNGHPAVDTTNRRFPGAATCVAIYSRAVNAETALADVLRDDYPWCAHCDDALRALFAAYVEAKQKQQILDFDDLLLYWAEMLTEPHFAIEIGARFDYVLVDEYQDTNRLQASILHRLKPEGRGVTVVGDDAQAIYGFRAATVRNILEFPGPLRAGGRRDHARSQLPLDRGDPGCVERSDRAGARTLCEGAHDGSRQR